jgi:hypothetical protein
MRKLLCWLAAMLLLGKLEVAEACSMPNPPSDEQLFEKASTVFIGHIIRTEEIQFRYPQAASTGPAVEGAFRLIEVLKGEPPPDGKVVGPIPAMCMMPLMVGLDYIIFLNEGSTFIGWALEKGTRPLPSEGPAAVGTRPSHGESALPASGVHPAEASRPEQEGEGAMKPMVQ